MASLLSPADTLTPLTESLLDTTTHPPVQSALRKLNLLLVEDSAADALLTRKAIEATGYDVTLTRLHRGGDVLPALRLRQRGYPVTLPDMILLDLGLPDASGFEILEDLAHAHPALRAVPVVILTAHQHFDYLCKMDSLFVEDYINKPCTKSEMNRILRKIARLAH